MRAARGALIVTLDGDGQNPPDQIPALLAPFTKPGSAALGLVQGERIGRKDTALKRLASRADTIEELEWRLDAQNVDEAWDSSTEAHARIAKPLRGGGAESTATPQTARRWFFHA